MSEAPSAEWIRDALGLHPSLTCGFMAETYGQGPPAPPASRGAVFTFLITPETPGHLHRIPSDQMYHHYLGDPLEVLLLHSDGRGELSVVGADLAAGQRPQLLIPGGTFHAGRVRDGGRYALMGTSVWNRVEASGVVLGDLDQLTQSHPTMASLLALFAASAQL
ncbi:cupin domain-containing protein [Cyanobium sp. Morenito 9A2]|uniref:cupin domain-containing protein n=1 Tax=Cyanobium sp. Morenito 9A2 TaxID=2823718 RepID=UPI0020CB7D18|nr:cupin domain-containing protein [Cyanobium sp. Morenito 9A2]MCP9848577.1 cupin domain-containing protein [Cyanobium sp. Morenito 9A2]